MNYTVSGKNIEITNGLREAVIDKLSKLERYFTPDTEVNVTLSVEKDRQRIEVDILHFHACQLRDADTGGDQHLHDGPFLQRPACSPESVNFNV